MSEQRERPILFSGPMVRAILEGRKTQTRRIVKGLPDGIRFASALPESGYQYRFTDFKETTVDLHCPYGRPPIPLESADRLWVRETHFLYGYWRKTKGHWRFHQITKGAMDNSSVYYPDDPPDEIAATRTTRGWHKRPAIFMPRWASRITLAITSIRVERLQTLVLSFDDLIAEGMEYDPHESMIGPCDADITLSLAERFGAGWDALNAKRGYSWESNPWVWVVEFKKL